jgi:hypothetical protein
MELVSFGNLVRTFASSRHAAYFGIRHRSLYRIRPFHYGQGRQLGSSRFHVAHDL